MSIEHVHFNKSLQYIYCLQPASLVVEQKSLITVKLQYASVIEYYTSSQHLNMGKTKERGTANTVQTFRLASNRAGTYTTYIGAWKISELHS